MNLISTLTRRGFARRRRFVLRVAALVAGRGPAEPPGCSAIRLS